MKFNYCLKSLAVMAIFASCQDDTELLNAPLKGSEVTVTAVREGAPHSRTVLNDEGKINWHADDKLSVFLGSNVGQPFTIHAGAGTDYATFKGSGDIFITGGSESSTGAFTNVAYYPYDQNVQIAQGANGVYTIATSLPSNQTYRQGSFGQDTYHMIAVAESNRDYAFKFKNVGSMFKLYLKGSAEITKIELESQANKLAGACTVEAAYGEEPSVILDANSAESKITLDCMTEVEEGVTEGVQLSETESTVFVISVPPIAGSVEDLTFTIYDANYGYMVYKNLAEYGVDRNEYYSFGFTTAVEYKATGYTKDYEEDGNGNAVIYTADGLVHAATNLFPNGGTFKIAADIDMTNVQYPSVDFQKDVEFIIDGGNHTITGLNMPLINSTWSAGELVQVMNLTLENPAIAIDVEDTEGDVRVGAFIAGPSASDNVVLDNCHVDGGYVKGGHWTGGLVGAADGYNGSDGPVFETLTITGCSVKNCAIEGKGSVGGIIGHGAFNAWTLVDMDNITVSGNTIKSTGSDNNKAGSVMGTIGAAQTATVVGGTESKDGYISVDNATIENNTVTSNGTVIDRIYGRQGTPGGTLYIDGVRVVFSLTELQAILDNATSDITLSLHSNITGDVKITQKNGVNIVIDGNDNTFKGVMTTYGNGRQSGTETLTIKNIKFVAANGASSCIVSPDRSINNAYSYSHNVTVEDCTFTDPDGTVNCAAIRQEDGGDKNWTVMGCTVDDTMHSILQVNNVEGKLTIDDCTVSSKNGANLNCCTNVEMIACRFDVKGYAVRLGVKDGGNLGETKTCSITSSTLKSACDDGDAVIMFRASAVDATLTLTETTLDGTTKISGNTADTTINGTY